MHSGSTLGASVSHSACARKYGLWLLLGVYFLSGVTGVAYEVLWVRMLSIQFGVSSFGVIMTIAVFMAGLGLGSLVGTHISTRVARPLLLLAGLEASVALFALSMPWLFGVIDGMLGEVAASWPLSLWYLVQAGIAFLLLFVPCLALGIGFPLVLRIVRGSGTSLAAVYGINTVGGAVGALAPLALLPLLGWSYAMQAVAVLGLLVAGAFGLLAQFKVLPHAAPPSHATQRPGWTVLLVYGAIGAAALMVEIGWTRLYGMILLRTEYVLAIILFIFLAGIGLGSLLARWLPPRLGLQWFPLFAALAGLYSLWGLTALAAWAGNAHFDSLFQAMLMQGLALALLTLPLTLILGAWLPLLVRRLAGGEPLSGAWLYGANAVGAALGAVACGFLLVPAVGTAATIALASILLFTFGMRWSQQRWLWLAMPLLIVAAWPLQRLPPVKALLPKHAESRQLMLYEDAISITHVIEEPDGQRILLSDLRRMDASTEPTAVVVQKNQARLPLLLHGSPRTVLFLGLGTGISASAVLALPGTETTAVELSSGAISAARSFFAPVNGGVVERIRVVHDDARRYLRAGEARYDVIVGDLFHPDMVGRSNLLSVQQFRRVRERLADGGVYVQWLALNQFDRETVATVMRSFQQVFPHGALYLDGFRLALVGPSERMASLLARAQSAWQQRLSEAQRERLTGGEGIWTWLGRYWGPIRMLPGPLQDEWAPQIEFRLPALRYGNGMELAATLEWLLGLRPSPEEAGRQLGLNSGPDHESFERAYIATELAARSWLAAFRGHAGEAQRLIRFAYEANPDDRWVGYDLADRIYASLSQLAEDDRYAVLDRILTIRPDHVQALKAMLRLELARNPDSPAIERYRERLRKISPLGHLP